MLAALSLHSCHYNWARKHQTIGTTPAQALGVASREWTIADIVRLLEPEGNRIPESD